MDGVAHGVDAKGRGDEEAKDFLGGARAPAHQPRDVQQREQHQEEGTPQTDASVHGVKVQLQILANAEYHCQKSTGWPRESEKKMIRLHSQQHRNSLVLNA